MMETKDIAKETIEVLKYFDASLIAKISNNLLKLLEELSRKSDKVVNIDLNKKLKDQNISEECKNLIALIYYNYIADENEKKDIVKIWNDNEYIYQQELDKKYNVDEIFKKRKTVAIEELPIVVKENLFQKIIKFIKRFINK